MASPSNGFASPPPTVPDVVLSFPRPKILLVTLNRPRHLNAMPRPQHSAMERLWAWYDAEPSLRCAVITGAGRAFCAGADLKEWKATHDSPSSPPSSSSTVEVSQEKAKEDGKGSDLSDAGFGGLSNRAGLKPVIAAVNGLCLGGGMEMAINTDLVVAASDAQFGLPEVAIGVVAIAGALPRLVRCVGLQRASEMALTGRSYPAETMLAWGLVNAVVPREKVVDEALSLAEKIAGNSPDAVVVSRAGIRLGWEAMGPREGTAGLAEGMYRSMDGGENMREGITSFVERRKPVWKDSKL